jgi:hypothetical protein
LREALPQKPFAADANAMDIAAADVNGDDATDLFVVWTKQQPFYRGRWIQVLVNNGNGTFRDDTSAHLPQSDNLDQWFKFLVLSDADGDGDLDLFAKSSWWTVASPLFVNGGDGRFSESGLGFVLGGMHALLDVDKDGGRDLIAFASVNGGIVVRRHRELSAARAPSPPASVVASDGAFSDRVLVSWSTAWAASTYEVWRGSPTGGTDQRVTTTDATRFVDTTASPAVQYRYSVRSVRVGGTSAPSRPDLGHVAGVAGGSPSAPTNFLADLNGTTLRLSWTQPSTGVAPGDYVLQAALDPNFTAVIYNQGTGSSGTSLTITGVPPGVYYLRVLGRAGARTGPPSNTQRIASARTSCSTPPPPPSAFAISKLGGSRVRLSWSPGPSDESAAADYVIQAAMDEGFAVTVYNAPLGQAVTVLETDAPLGPTFFVRVIARNACGDSRPSSPVSFSVP